MSITTRQARVIGMFVGVLSVAPAIRSEADTISLSHTFETANQSMWSTGSAFTFAYDKFFGVSFNESVSRRLFAPFSDWVVTGTTRGKMGLDVSLNVNSGSVSAVVPTDIRLSYQGVNDFSQPLRVGSSALFGVGSSLTTQSPTISASADLVLQLSASLSGVDTDCGFFDPGPCSGGGTIVNVDKSKELLALNKDNDGQLRLLGTNYGFGSHDIAQGMGSYTISLPNIVTSDTGVPLNSHGSANFLEITADLDKIATTVLGLPPLSGTLFEDFCCLPDVDYNLLSAGLGLDISVFQDFSLQPNVVVRLDVAETGRSYQFLAGTDSPDIDPEDFLALHITPTFSMVGNFTNRSGIQLDPFVTASGGSFSSCCGLSFGPLFDLRYDLSVPALDLANLGFNLGGFNSVTGPSFTLTAEAADPDTQPVPEPGTLVLLGMGLGTAAWKRKKAARSRPASTFL